MCSRALQLPRTSLLGQTIILVVIDSNEPKPLFPGTNILCSPNFFRNSIIAVLVHLQLNCVINHIINWDLDRLLLRVRRQSNIVIAQRTRSTSSIGIKRYQVDKIYVILTKLSNLHQQLRQLYTGCPVMTQPQTSEPQNKKKYEWTFGRKRPQFSQLPFS